MIERFKDAWKVLTKGRDPTYSYDYGYGGSDARAYRPFLRSGITKSIANTVYNKIAVDVSAMNFNHVRLDEEGKYKETIDDSLNYVLSLSANLDQTGRELIKDTTLTMLSEGAACIVPYKTDVSPNKTDSYKVLEARVGSIVQWYPRHVIVEIYNDTTGQREQIALEKRICVIVQNPFYEIMNSNSSTLKRLVRVLNQLDKANEENSANKFDLLIQLPYSTGKKIRKEQAESRRKELEDQLIDSKMGIGYVDASERVIQLNRPVENTLWQQSKDLLIELFNQLGLSEAIFKGTANEQELLNYQNSTITPIVNAICENMTRKWISVTGQSQKQSIMAFTNAFKSVPVSQLADVSDKLTRNEILTSNEFRSIIGFKPVDDPKADELRNSNLNHPDEKANLEESANNNIEDESNPMSLKQLINKYKKNSK